MILLIDVGSTRLKWATWDGQFQFGDALAHAEKPLEIFSTLSLTKVSAVWISLVPRMGDVEGWSAAVQQKFGIAPHFVQSRAEWRGMRSAYSQPEKLGVDRWLALVALWNEQPSAFCVVSAGTALTVDRVNAQGQHLGGVIAQGFGSMHRSLLSATLTTFSDTGHRYGPELGQDSLAAIAQGTFFATIGVIGNALRAPGADPAERRIITGGDSAALIPYLTGPWQHRPHLVLEGLLALARVQA